MSEADVMSAADFVFEYFNQRDPDAVSKALDAWDEYRATVAALDELPAALSAPSDSAEDKQ